MKIQINQLKKLKWILKSKLICINIQFIKNNHKILKKMRIYKYNNKIFQKMFNQILKKIFNLSIVLFNNLIKMKIKKK